ncbi:ROK family transcriptional regulator [Microbispora corallina]|uniref:ROK family transcriptional regulator n=1 Tax=Microbispora corallina TaxID=83302 RepID=A0ABQ4FZG5_9ACTN|nr:ROK family transcriptional regulator [Microbispora corallina]GIH40185.1 hypothetical protein Mco01_31850 [Microbispora corallina]
MRDRRHRPYQTAELTAPGRAVLGLLARGGEFTRPYISTQLEMSKPTVSLAIAELEAAGLVEMVGTSQGFTGRSAALYALSDSAGYVLGVDLGSTRVHVMAAALTGEILAERYRTHPAADPHPGAANPALASAARRLLPEVVAGIGESRGPLRAISVAIPMVVPPDRSLLTEEDLDAWAGIWPPLVDAWRGWGLDLDLPVRVANNVNCSALAELHWGAARGREDYVFVQVGVGIALGIVSRSQVVVGANGAAGEVVRMPYPWAENQPPRPKALEAHLDAGGLMARCRRLWPRDAGQPPADAERLFSLAADGHPVARSLVEDHATEVGRLVAAIVAVLDPGLVVLGGGVGQNPLLLPGVIKVLQETSWPTLVLPGQLGAQATVKGAVRLAVEEGRAALLDG